MSVRRPVARRSGPLRAARGIGRALLAAGCLLAATAHASEPFRLDEALGLPESLEIDVWHRSRFEFVHDQFRGALSGSDQILVFKTSVHARWTPNAWLRCGAELLDARSQLDDSGTPLDTGIVNATELLQAYVEARGEAPGARPFRLRGGRLTLDVGSRRFVSRNRFRNTINAHTGLEAEIEPFEGHRLRAFYLLPIQRLPTRRGRLADNQIEVDEESFRRRFWGLFYEASMPWESTLELYAFGLDEDDSSELLTRQREIVTPGFRIHRRPAPGRIDVQLENVVQVGEVRANTTTNQDLDHFAHFHHASVGYTAPIPWHPRFVAQFDYASGDDDPTDGDSGRFDTLFGSRRFELGPTGIFGPFVRANLLTPGGRVIVRPGERSELMVAYRAFWLAEGKGNASVFGLQDPTGDSGRFVGSLFEVRARWTILPGNLKLEAGWAHLFAGGFVENVPGNNGQGDSDYAYTQFIVEF